MKLMARITVFLLILLLLPACTQQVDEQGTVEHSSIIEEEPAIEESAPEVALDDLDALTAKYLERPMRALVLTENWTMGANVNYQALVDFYVIGMMEQGLEHKEIDMSSETVDAYLDQYFDFGADGDNGIKYSVAYDEETDRYTTGGLGGGGWGEVVSARLEEDRLLLTYEVYSPDDGEVVWDGVLTVRLEPDGGYRYIENFMQYPEFPVTDDPAYLEELSITYVQPLLYTYGLSLQDWSEYDQVPPDNYILFCASNNLLGMERDEADEYVEPYAPAADVEAAIQQYFEVPSEYLRTSALYEWFDKATGTEHQQTYRMPSGYGGGGFIWALAADEEGDLLHITVGLYGPDDALGRPRSTTVLTVRLNDDGFQYVSNRIDI